ncbi:hypothetical protein [Methanobrevibacter sp.]
MNKMVIFLVRHPRFPDVFIKGLVDGDYLLDEEAQEYAEGIIQYYQKDKLRWRFPVNQFMKNSIKYNSYEELKRIIDDNEKDFACTVFKGDKNKTYCTFEDLKIEREVLTW